MNTDLGEKNHSRIFQLEGISNDPIQLPDHFIAGKMLKHINNGIAQMSLQHWQSWGINHFSKEPVPVVDHHLSEEMIPNIQSKPPLATIPTSSREKRSALPSSISHLRNLERASQPSFLQTGQVQSPQQFLSCKASFHPFH